MRMNLYVSSMRCADASAFSRQVLYCRCTLPSLSHTYQACVLQLNCVVQPSYQVPCLVAVIQQVHARFGSAPINNTRQLACTEHLRVFERRAFDR